MKFQTLAFAATLVLGSAAFAAAPNDSTKTPASPDPTHAVEMKHDATKHMAKKIHSATHMAKHQAMHERSTSVQTDMNSSSREARMDEALRNFRSKQS